MLIIQNESYNAVYYYTTYVCVLLTRLYVMKILNVVSD